jgi:hypothetical protein
VTVSARCTWLRAFVQQQPARRPRLALIYLSLLYHDHRPRSSQHTLHGPSLFLAVEWPVIPIPLPLKRWPNLQLCASAIYTVYTSPTHPPIPNHLPTLIVTPHGALCLCAQDTTVIEFLCTGQPSNILYSYLHTNYVSLSCATTNSPRSHNDLEH